MIGGEKLWQRVGDPLEWDTGLKCAVAAALLVPIGAVYLLVLHWVLAHPEAAPYLDPYVTGRMADVQGYVIVPAWAVIGLLGIWGRERWRARGLLPHLVCQVYNLWFGWCAYALGPNTSSYPAITLYGGFTYMLALFDRVPAVLGLVSFVGVLLGTSMATTLGVLPYAPMLRSAPFHDGRLEPSWLIGVGGAEAVSFGVALSVIFLVILRWHEREEKLAQVTTLVSRYVAGQLSRQILSGQIDRIERRDRRRLTLVFADICDFSAIADRLEPEEVSELLNAYLSEMATIAESHGGTVDQFVGDGLVVMFGAPTDMPEREQALRAVRMAVAMQNRVAELHADWRSRGFDEEFRVRIGINTGIASVGNFGSRERVTYTAIGRQVALAARLEVACDPGAVLLSHSTWSLVRNDVPCVPRGELSVKGSHVPIKTYEVHRGLSATAIRQM